MNLEYNTITGGKARELPSRQERCAQRRVDIGETYARAIADFNVASDQLMRGHLLRVMRDPNASAEMGLEAAKMTATGVPDRRGSRRREDGSLSGPPQRRFCLGLRALALIPARQVTRPGKQMPSPAQRTPAK
jgi:hypothetical protein